MKLNVRRPFYHMAALAVVGLVVGMVSAFATVGFVEMVAYLNELFFVSASRRDGLDTLQLAAVTIGALTLGGLAVGLILRYGVSEKASLGPVDTIYAVQLQERLPSPVSGVTSTLAAMLALGCGAPVGQYGPLVYLGTLVGQFATRFRIGIRDLRSMAIACGVAAAIATAFNTPIAALVFAHEVILRHQSLRMFTAVTVACASAYLVANVIFQQPPLFLMEISGQFRGIEFLFFAIEGIACGTLAVILMKSLDYTAGLSRRINLPAAAKPMLAGFAVSLVVLQVPEALGIGHGVLRLVSAGGYFSADALLVILVAKLLVTVVCIGFGFAGGVIFPSMLIGVLAGALFAELVPGNILNGYSGLPVYAICGMVALMGPVIGSPMTAVLMVFELTRSYETTIAAMVAIVFANLISHYWYGRSLYDRQLAARGVDLSEGRMRAYLSHRKIIQHATESLPVSAVSTNVGELRQTMTSLDTDSAVITDDKGVYLGIVSQHQLAELDDDTSVGQLEYQRGTLFDEKTSIWDAMEVMRDFIGEAIAVVDSRSGHYLGSVPEAAVINAYLDASHELRREEHEV